MTGETALFQSIKIHISTDFSNQLMPIREGLHKALVWISLSFKESKSVIKLSRFCSSLLYILKPEGNTGLFNSNNMQKKYGRIVIN